MNADLGKILKLLVEALQPDLRKYLRLSLVGKVTKADPDAYTVEVSVPGGLVLPDVPVSALFAQDGYGIWALPEIGAEVVVSFEEGDLTRPYVEAPTWRQNKPPSGYRAGMIAIVDRMKQEVRIDPEQGTITVKGKAKVIVDAPVIEIGEGAAEAMVKGTTLAGLLKGHTHGFNPTSQTVLISPDLQSLDTALSTKAKVL